MRLHAKLAKASEVAKRLSRLKGAALTARWVRPQAGALGTPEASVAVVGGEILLLWVPDGMVGRADPLAVGQAHPARCEEAGELLVVGRPGAGVPGSLSGEGCACPSQLRLAEQEARRARGLLACGGRRAASCGLPRT
eukprot:scaffold1782_cov123-Isochrysis_galbana.AAC.3